MQTNHKPQLPTHVDTNTHPVVPVDNSPRHTGIAADGYNVSSRDHWENLFIGVWNNVSKPLVCGMSLIVAVNL